MRSNHHHHPTKRAQDKSLDRGSRHVVGGKDGIGPLPSQAASFFESRCGHFNNLNASHVQNIVELLDGAA
jgi:hypothetical protein